MDRRPLLALVPIGSIALFAGACSGAEPSTPAEADHHDDGVENVANASSALAANDSVATAVNQSCTTTAVKGLATQLVQEIQCLRPNTFAKIDNTAGLALGAAVFPYLQTNAASALVAAQKARGVTMSINSGLRTLPQQYLLYRWYQTGRCGIGLAARPGTSNHESALAVDIEDNAGWRTAMQGKNFRWLGASDPVHYDFVGGGTVDLRGLSVRAFQRLWNRNNPTETITEDGAYGPATEAKLAKSPIGGFAKGAPADCNKTTSADGGADSGATPENTKPSDVPVIPDATESGDDTTSGDGAQTNARGTPSPSVLPPQRIDVDATGCSATPRPRGAGDGEAWPIAAVALGATFLRRLRRALRMRRS